MLSESAVRRRPWTYVVVLLGGLASVCLTAIGGLFLVTLLSPLGWPAGPPSGWTRLTRLPAASDVLGSYVLTGKERNLRFADGTQRALAVGDETLTLHADGTYLFQHRGIYNGHSQVNCVATQIGSWRVDPNFEGKAQLVLVADEARTRIEHRMLTEEQMERLLRDASGPYARPEQVAEQRDADGCSFTRAIDWNNSLPLARNRQGEIGFYHEAPALPLESSIFPWKIIRIATLIYIREPDSPRS